MKSKKYYAVYADNGFLCSNNWGQVVKMQKYFHGDRCKGYKSKDDAMIATKQGYNEIHILSQFIGHIELNIPRFTKDFTEDEVMYSNDYDL